MHSELPYAAFESLCDPGSVSVFSHVSLQLSRPHLRGSDSDKQLMISSHAQTLSPSDVTAPPRCHYLEAPLLLLSNWETLPSVLDPHAAASVRLLRTMPRALCSHCCTGTLLLAPIMLLTVPSPRQACPLVRPLCLLFPGPSMRSPGLCRPGSFLSRGFPFRCRLLGEAFAGQLI